MTRPPVDSGMHVLDAAPRFEGAYALADSLGRAVQGYGSSKKGDVMKFLNLSAMVLIVSIPLYSPAVWAQQLLFNPGFEAGAAAVSCSSGTLRVSGQLGRGWGDNSCWIGSNSALLYSLDASSPRSGSVSQVIESTLGLGQFWTPLSFSAGKRYAASIWLKADQAMEVSLLLRAEGVPYTQYGSIVAKVTTQWQQFTFDAEAPVASGSVPGGLFVVLRQPGKLWLDEASVTAVADTSPDTLRTGVVPKSYFGMHIHRDPRWPAVGGTIGSYRLWDTEGTQWADIYPVDPALGGAPDWAEFDARLNAAIANGAEPVVVLGGNIPKWASSDPTGIRSGANAYGPGSSAPPLKESAWVQWVTAVAQRAQGRVKHWEIWNEPYQSAAFRVDVPRLVRLAQLAYPILKNAAPDSTVLSPSFDIYDNSFLERYLQAGGGAYMDVVSLHAYDTFVGNLLDGTVAAAARKGDPASAETLFYQDHLIRNTKRVLARYNQQGKPVWNTESGYESRSATGLPNAGGAVSLMARHLILGWAVGGLDRSFYYSWDHRSSFASGGDEQIAGSNVYVVNNVGKAYEQVAKWLTGAQMESKSVDSNGSWTIVLNRGASLPRQYLVWNPKGAYGYTVPSGTNYVTHITRLDGSKTTISSPFVATPSPVLMTRN